MSNNSVLSNLQQIVGEDFVSKERELIEVLPQNTQEIQKIVQLANQENIHLFTDTIDDKFHGISNGDSSGIFINFKRMKKISNINLVSRSVIIEPGVSFVQLQKELENHGLSAMNPIGLPGSVSVLNCYVERSPLLSAPKPLLAEGWQCILDMEVVLPTGEILKTGASALSNMKKTFYWPFGSGPDLSRVISGSQGTFGLATKASIKVKVMPESRKILFLSFDKIEDIIDPLYKIERTEIGEMCLLLNKFSFSTLFSENSSDQKALLEKLPEWILILYLAGPEEKIKYEVEDLIDIGITPSSSIVSSESSEKIVLDELSCPDRISKLLNYKENCRKISFYTIIDRLSEFHEKVGTILQAEDHPKQELGILITPIELGRACFIEYLIFADGSEKEKVEKLYLEIYKQVVDLGGNVDRPYGPVAGMVYAKNPVHSNFLKFVRDQFDPKGIMNPNRLIT